MIKYQPLQTKGFSLMDDDIMDICNENNLSSDFLNENIESDLYRNIKKMYIPNSLEQYHEFLHPFCMMSMMMIMDRGRLVHMGNSLIAIPKESYREWEMRLIIRTNYSHSIHIQKQLEISTESECKDETCNRKEDDEKNETVINTIKKVMTLRLLNSLKIEKESSKGKTIEIPIVNSIQELLYHYTSFIKITTVISRIECYYEIDDCFHFHLILKDPFQDIYNEPVYSFKFILGSIKFTPKLTIGSNQSQVSSYSVYNLAIRILWLSSWPHLRTASTLGLKMASLYLTNSQHESYDHYSIEQLEKLFKKRALTEDNHPIHGLVLLAAINGLYSLSSIQVLVNNCSDINELTKKVNSITPIRSLIVTICERNTYDNVMKFFHYWKMNDWEERYTIPFYLNILKRANPNEDLKVIEVVDLSRVDFSIKYPENCNLEMLCEIYEQIFNENLNDYSMNSLIFKIENETDEFIKKWKALRLRKGKLINVLERSSTTLLDLESKFPFEVDSRFTKDVHVTLMLLDLKIYYLQRYQKPEIDKMIKHLSFWHTCIEFSFLSVLHYTTLGNNQVFKFLFWIKEIQRVLNHICSILDAHLPDDLLKESYCNEFKDGIISDIYNRKLSMKEIESFIEEQCFIASLNSDRMIMSTLNNLYILLCQYIQ